MRREARQACQSLQRAPSCTGLNSWPGQGSGAYGATERKPSLYFGVVPGGPGLSGPGSGLAICTAVPGEGWAGAGDRLWTRDTGQAGRQEQEGPYRVSETLLFFSAPREKQESPVCRDQRAPEAPP